MRRTGLSCPREGQAEDFAAGCHFLVPQDERHEEGRKGWKGRVQS